MTSQIKASEDQRPSPVCVCVPGVEAGAQDLTEDEEAEAADEDVVEDVTAEDEDDEAEVEDDENTELVRRTRHPGGGCRPWGGL